MDLLRDRHSEPQAKSRSETETSEANPVPKMLHHPEQSKSSSQAEETRFFTPLRSVQNDNFEDYPTFWIALITKKLF